MKPFAEIEEIPNGFEHSAFWYPEHLEGITARKMLEASDSGMRTVSTAPRVSLPSQHALLVRQNIAAQRAAPVDIWKGWTYAYRNRPRWNKN